MNKCWFSKNKRNTAIFCSIFFAILAIIQLGLFSEDYMEINLINLFKRLLVCAILLSLSFFGYLVYVSRLYQATVEKFSLQNFKKKIMYSWDEISEISICDVHNAAKGHSHEKVIRVVIGYEKNGPTNYKCPRNFSGRLERWRGLMYSFLHYKKIILIEYSEERLNQIKEVCGKEIKDYRTNSWYKYPIAANEKEC